MNRHSIVHSVNLNEVKLVNAESPSCLNLEETNTSSQTLMCVMQYAPGDHEQVMKKLKEDITFMKEKCQQPMKTQKGSTKVMNQIMGIENEALKSTKITQSQMAQMDQEEQNTPMAKLAQEKSIEKDGMKDILKELEFDSMRERENSQHLQIENVN